MVKAIVLSDEHTIIIQCDFIGGSDAQGCVVVIVGEVDNLTATVTRNDSTLSVGSIAIPSHRTTSQYVDIFGYDLEAGGSVGKVGVPGELYHVNIATNNVVIGRLTNEYCRHGSIL